MTNTVISATISKDKRTAYLKLPGYSGESGSVKRTISLSEVIVGYRGPMINIDFDADGLVVGVEVLVFERNLNND